MPLKLNQPLSPEWKAFLASSPPSEHSPTTLRELEGLSFLEFNRAIGNPVRPEPDENGLPVLCDLAPYQVSVGEYEGRDLQITKSEKIGITEAVLRWIIWKTTNPDPILGNCKGYQVMLGAQDLNVAKRNLRRLEDIFLQSPILSRIVDGEPGRTEMLLKDGTYFFVMPRAASAFQGWDRVKIAFLDESAHYGLLDDRAILNSALGRLTNTQGYLRTVSRPNGQRGFFYQRHLLADPERNPNARIKEFIFDYHLGIMAKLITEEWIDKMRLDLGTLFPQHYECKFLSNESAAIPQELIDENQEDYELESLD